MADVNYGPFGIWGPVGLLFGGEILSGTGIDSLERLDAWRPSDPLGLRIVSVHCLVWIERGEPMSAI